MVSKKTVHISGLALDIYGLEEYWLKEKQSQKRPRLAVLFALHGLLCDRESVEPICQSVCNLSGTSNGGKHLLAVSFDHMNHGPRYVGESVTPPGAHKAPNATFRHSSTWEMWITAQLSVRTIQLLMDTLEGYLFGADSLGRIENWGVFGFSLGGVASSMAAAQDPRLSVCISVSGIPDLAAIARNLFHLSRDTQEKYFSRQWGEQMDSVTHNLDVQLSQTKLLLMAGDNDRLVGGRVIRDFARRVRREHRGQEGYDWALAIFPSIGHKLTGEMINKATEWCHRWMLETGKGDQLVAKL